MKLLKRLWNFLFGKKEVKVNPNAGIKPTVDINLEDFEKKRGSEPMGAPKHVRKFK